MESLIDEFGPLQQRLVFITDGAAWLRNWIEDAYPQAVSILDFYHVLEHLQVFSAAAFKQKDLEQKWVEQQKALLLDSRLEEVMTNICSAADNKTQKQAAHLIGYYQSNAHRMDYKTYQQIGCGLIGSGAIESAHRTVIQKRMKQSGQRWSVKGAQHMLNLRVVRKNHQWSKIVALSKTNFKLAA